MQHGRRGRERAGVGWSWGSLGRGNVRGFAKGPSGSPSQQAVPYLKSMVWAVGCAEKEGIKGVCNYFPNTQLPDGSKITVRAPLYPVEEACS